MAEIKPNDAYNKAAKQWRKVRDVDAGEHALKENDVKQVGKGSTADTYLRLINPLDVSSRNQAQNKAYINGARFYNATARTATGLLGMLYRVDPVVADLPPDLEYIIDNADGSGLSLSQLSKATASNVIKIGRDGLLCDMPISDGAEKTAADVANGFRPTIKRYCSESIIDWHEAVINGTKKLDLLVLRELIEVFTDELIIERETQEQFHVYRLTSGNVTLQVYANTKNGVEIIAEHEIKGANNQPLNQILFSFVGSVNNSPDIDNLPMADISNINIGHYQESANLSSSSFNVSAVTPWIADDNYQQAVQNSNGEDSTAKLGENTMMVLGSGGSFNLAQPNANTMSAGMMESYKEQMIGLGASLITSSSGNETAEAARIKHSSDVSVLDLISANVSDAYTKMLEYCCLFLGIEYKDYTFTLNKDFFDSLLTAQDLDALVRTWQSGAISKNVMDLKLVAGGVIAEEEDLELMNTAIAEEAGSNVNFDEQP